MISYCMLLLADSHVRVYILPDSIFMSVCISFIVCSKDPVHNQLRSKRGIARQIIVSLSFAHDVTKVANCVNIVCISCCLLVRRVCFVIYDVLRSWIAKADADTEGVVIEVDPVIIDVAPVLIDHED